MHVYPDSTSAPSGTFTETPRSPGEVESLRHEIEALANTIDRLGSRLQPVLREVGPVPADQAPEQAPLSEIAAVRRAIGIQTMRLNDLIDRIDA